METCYLCEKEKMQKKKVPYTFDGHLVGYFDGEVCGACHETFFDEITSQKISAEVKQVRKIINI